MQMSYFHPLFPQNIELVYATQSHSKFLELGFDLIHEASSHVESESKKQDDSKDEPLYLDKEARIDNSDINDSSLIMPRHLSPQGVQIYPHLSHYKKENLRVYSVENSSLHLSQAIYQEGEIVKTNKTSQSSGRALSHSELEAEIKMSEAEEKKSNLGCDHYTIHMGAHMLVQSAHNLSFLNALATPKERFFCGVDA